MRPCHMTRTPPMAVQYTGHVIQTESGDTACHWWEFWSHDTEVFIILSIISINY